MHAVARPVYAVRDQDRAHGEIDSGCQTHRGHDHPELTGHIRDRITNQLGPLRDKLSDEAFEKAWEKGRGLGIDDVVAQLRTSWTKF